MKRSIGTLILAGTLALGIAPVSHAKVYTLARDSGVEYYGFATRGTFTDQFSFSLASDSVVTGTFFKFLINKVNLSFKAIADSTWTPVSSNHGNPAFDTFALGSNPLNSGEYLFRITGNGVGAIPARIYGGALAVAPVPEPETWAMLSVGSLLVAYQLRRKQKALSQQPVAA